MQGDYTRKTQALSDERKVFEATRTSSLEETAKLLEIASAMVYGQRPAHNTEELLALKQTDPYAYEQALENRVLFEQREQEINAIAQQVHDQHTGQQQENLKAESTGNLVVATTVAPERNSINVI